MSTTTNQHYSLLRDLRSLAPARPLSYSELLRIAERQAARLSAYLGRDGERLDFANLDRLPRVTFQATSGLPVSGVSHWTGSTWVIAVSASEPKVRQRFTVLHELWHVIQHGREDRLSATQLERVADYFAGCALMPRPLLKRLWCSGIQRLDRLAFRFDVSQRAVEVRLLQIGLTEPRARCLPTAEVPREVAA
jgi:hypothetical protein